MAKIAITVQKKQIGTLVFDYEYVEGISKRAQNLRIKKAAEKYLEETKDRDVKWLEPYEYYDPDEITVSYSDCWWDVTDTLDENAN